MLIAQVIWRIENQQQAMSSSFKMDVFLGIQIKKKLKRCNERAEYIALSGCGQEEDVVKSSIQRTRQFFIVSFSFQAH